MKILLIPCGATEWRTRGRLLGRVQVALSDTGRTRITEWAAAMSAAGAGKIFHSSDDLAAETAKLIAGPIGAATRVMRELDEVDMGLWAGLTEGQLKSRFRSAYRQLVESPLSVAPPEGEPIAAAVERITQAMEKRISQNGVPAAAFVLRPMALAIARCNLEHRPMSELWTASHYDDGPLSIDTEQPGPAASFVSIVTPRSTAEQASSKKPAVRRKRAPRALPETATDAARAVDSPGTEKSSADTTASADAKAPCVPTSPGPANPRGDSISPPPATNDPARSAT